MEIHISVDRPPRVDPPAGFRRELDGKSLEGDWSGCLGAPSGCWLSDDNAYRTLLWRTFQDVGFLQRPPLVFGMMNPSTATHLLLDPTVRRCLGFARREGAGGIIVVNRSPWRATHQRDLELAFLHKIDVMLWERNIEAWEVAAVLGGDLIAAWGTPRGVWWGYAQARRADLLRPFAGRTYTIGTPAKSGEPKHPLYLRNEAPFLPYMPA